MTAWKYPLFRLAGDAPDEAGWLAVAVAVAVTVAVAVAVSAFSFCFHLFFRLVQ